MAGGNAQARVRRMIGRLWRSGMCVLVRRMLWRPGNDMGMITRRRCRNCAAARTDAALDSMTTESRHRKSLAGPVTIEGGYSKSGIGRQAMALSNADVSMTDR